VAPGATVALNFKHPFSKMNINITNELDNDAVTKVEIKDVFMDATLDIANETIALGTAKRSFEAVKIADNKYAAVIMPQKAAPAIVVTVASGKAYNFALSGEFTFEMGKAYTAAITLKPGATPPAPGEAVTFSFTVTAWADGGSLEYGEGEVYAPSWAVSGKLNGSEDWVDDAVVMTQTATGTEAFEGTWECDINYKAGDTFKLRWNRAWDMEAGMSGEADNIGLGESGLWGQGGKDIVFNNTVEDGSYHLKFVYNGYKLTVTKNAD
jgi:hypothetical protein